MKTFADITEKIAALLTAYVGFILIWIVVTGLIVGLMTVVCNVAYFIFGG